MLSKTFFNFNKIAKTLFYQNKNAENTSKNDKMSLLDRIFYLMAGK